MTFFTQAVGEGAIDEKIEMSEKELEMMVVGMVKDSNAWEMHKRKHKDAQIVPVFVESSEVEQKLVRNESKQESEIVQYDTHSKKFQAGCQCGQKFEIDVKKDEVTTANPSLKMKESGNYKKDTDENNSDMYGRAPQQNQGNIGYNNNSNNTSSNPSYNSNRINYKN